MIFIDGFLRKGGSGSCEKYDNVILLLLYCYFTVATSFMNPSDSSGCCGMAVKSIENEWKYDINDMMGNYDRCWWWVAL